MLIHDTECLYCGQVSLNNRNLNKDYIQIMATILICMYVPGLVPYVPGVLSRISRYKDHEKNSKFKVYFKTEFLLLDH